MRWTTDERNHDMVLAPRQDWQRFFFNLSVQPQVLASRMPLSCFSFFLLVLHYDRVEQFFQPVLSTLNRRFDLV